MSIITETVLFKSVAHKVTDVISPENLELALLRASTTRLGVDFSKTNVDRAMSWQLTPQGNDFWNKINMEYNRF